jgi:hypothetical protein
MRTYNDKLIFASLKNSLIRNPALAAKSLDHFKRKYSIIKKIMLFVMSIFTVWLSRILSLIGNRENFLLRIQTKETKKLFRWIPRLESMDDI